MWRVDGVKRFIETRLKLKVNTSKNAVDIAYRKFLGYSYYVSKRGTVSLRLGPGIAKRQRDKIREITRRNRDKGLINPVERYSLIR